MMNGIPKWWAIYWTKAWQWSPEYTFQNTSMNFDENLVIYLLNQISSLTESRINVVYGRTVVLLKRYSTAAINKVQK